MSDVTRIVEGLDDISDAELIDAIAECTRESRRLMALRDELIYIGMCRPGERVPRGRMAQAAEFGGLTPRTRLYQIRDKMAARKKALREGR